jgi:SAM-dependent methyltransferase
MSARAAEAFGQHGVSWVDRFGVWLSQRAIRRKLPPGDALEVIELGCGYRAKLLVALRDRLRRGVGVDFHIDPALQDLVPFTFSEGPIEETLPKLADASFDVVMLISVLEHLAAPLAALESTKRLLKPGGVLLINVPTWRGKFFLEFSAFRLGFSPKLEMDDHKMYYDKRDLWPLLVRAGFKPSRIRLRYHKFGLNLFAAAHRDDV